jgi:hypothetical protein
MRNLIRRIINEELSNDFSFLDDIKPYKNPFDGDLVVIWLDRPMEEWEKVKMEDYLIEYGVYSRTWNSTLGLIGNNFIRSKKLGSYKYIKTFINAGDEKVLTFGGCVDTG